MSGRWVPLRATPGEGEVFAPGCFDHLVGYAVPWHTERDGGWVTTGTATIDSVEIAPDGSFAVIFAQVDEIPTDTIDTGGRT